MSFWTTAPRKGFSHLCMQTFGCTFDAAVYKVTSETVPVTRGEKKAAPIYASAHDALSGYPRNNVSAMMSARAMKKRTLLIEVER